jgi:uncharacterized alkaline shock family protein YloU
VTEKGKQTSKIVIEENPSGIDGVITLDEKVVTTIAGLAAREVDGIHSIGRSRFFVLGDDPKRGVQAEVGDVQAAFDLDVVVDYGHDIRELARRLREKTADEVGKMAGRDVIEININVVGIELPEDLAGSEPRVR